MSEVIEIIGNTTATPNPRSDWTQADPAKADYIKNRPFYRGSSIEDYSCDKYNHQANVTGYYVNDAFGFATTEIVSLSDIGAYEIEVECDNQMPSNPSKETRTISLEGASVTMVAGGYVLGVDGFNNCPQARVYVITDASKFNRVCSCDLESNGTYLVISTRDGDQWSYITTVKVLRKYSVKKLDNVFLDLDNNCVIKTLLARIEELEAKINN